MVPEATEFFARRLALADVAEALQVRKRYVAGLGAYPAAQATEGLYQALVAFVLVQLRLPASSAAKHWEWRPVFGLWREVNPHYHTPQQISGRLDACPPMPPEARQTLQHALEGFLALARHDQLTALMRNEPEAVAAWTRLFPEGWGWQALALLRQEGLQPLGEQGGARALWRYARGTFQPPAEHAALRHWQQACQQQAVAPLAANDLDFLAAVFGGEYQALELDGPCTHLPRCNQCPLAKTCALAQGPLANHHDPQALLALAQGHNLTHMAMEDLLRAVLDIPPQAQARWNQALAQQGLRRLATLGLAELEALVGPPSQPAQRLRLLLELARRFDEERLVQGQAFATASEVFKHFRLRLRDFKQEVFLVVMLDSRRRFMGDFTLSQGTLENSLVHPREVFSPAIRERAAGLIVVHNHPSGDPHPSREDINVTQRLLESGRLLGIPLLDHIIIGDERFFSLLEHNLMPP